ncbi:MAG TPA: alpha/beta hydrolase [Pyrinomonadaceae bacterium]|nr:alpha/beta hydrolase [Pyrinomonadaceae bacterium]
MSPRRKLGKRLFRSLLPIALTILLAVVGALGYIVYCTSAPARRPYLLTPDSFQKISGRVLKVSDETWSNQDGTRARGWLLKGAEGAPAVILLHRYSADRSFLFNLGVKISETTNFTILWPDLRGHGMLPPVKRTTFGTREGDDLLAAIDFLRNVKSESKKKLVGDRFGVFGVELGAYAALKAARTDSQVKVLVLDSIPREPNELLRESVTKCLGVDVGSVQTLSRFATWISFFGNYESTTACEFAASLRDQHVLLLSGTDAGYLKASTASLQSCFANKANVEARTDLPLSGFSSPSATGEQGEAYDRIVIDFFDTYLR